MAAAAPAHDFDEDDDRSEASGFSDESLDVDSDTDSGAEASVEAGPSGDDGSDSADSDRSDGQGALGAVPDAAPGNDGGAAVGLKEAPSGPFKSADKGAAIAKAFAKATRGPRDASGAAILSGSKSVLKRQREEQASEAVDKQARLLRQEMRRRGHVKVPKRGKDPEHDVAEKALLRTARRGVVRLFNAVSKAQKQVVEQQAVGGRGKAQQLTKSDFLAELRGKPAAGVPSQGAVGVSASEQAAASDTPAWEALQDGENDFSALQSGLKMKDWDKRELPSTIAAETVPDMGTESDSD